MNRLDVLRSLPWIDAIGWALLHSLWQGAAVALGLAFVLGLLRGATANARYLAACAAMVLLIALPVFTLLRSEEIVANATDRRALDRAFARVEPSPRRAADDAVDHLRPWHLFVDGPRPFFPAIVAIWTAGLAVFSLRLSGGWVQARRWVRIDTRPLTESLIDRLCEQIGVRCRVVLFESSRVAVPMVVGWLRPAILVPVAALSGLTALEMEAILAHELAHIRRHDYLVNLVQCAIETLMFHHPATWWISRVIRREREHCCDDIAVLACRDRFVYARALAAMEGLRAPLFSLSPAASGGNLLARIRRILNPVEDSMKPVRIVVAMFVVVAFVPLWLVRGGEQAKAEPGSPRTVPDEREPFPNRSFSDFLSGVEAKPPGQSSAASAESQASKASLMLRNQAGAAEDPPSETEVWQKVNERGHSVDAANAAEAEKTFNLGAYYKKLGKVASAKYYFEKVTRRWPNSPSSAQAKADLTELAKTAPTPSRATDAVDGGVDAEKSKDEPPFYKVERNNGRMVIEKIGDKTDPVKVYPLAGPCQLVHRHFKCTVYFDDVFRSDWPIPFNHVNHRVEVVYIDKDFLRRAAPPAQTGEVARDQNASHGPQVHSRADRIDGIVREIEQLKGELQSDRQEQEQVLDRLIKELESLKKSTVQKK